MECFTKYCVVREAIRHFRALINFEGGIKALHNGGNYGDPLSLYLRALCREGMLVLVMYFYFFSFLEVLSSLLKEFKIYLIFCMKCQEFFSMHSIIVINFQQKEFLRQ